MIPHLLIAHFPRYMKGVGMMYGFSITDALLFCFTNGISKFVGPFSSLSARAYHHILKLARTIADLAECKEIQSVHLAEALQFRPKLMLS